MAQRQGFTQGALEALEKEVESCKNGLKGSTSRVHIAQLKSEIKMLVQLAQYYANCIRDREWLDLTYQEKLKHANENLIGSLKNDFLKEQAGRLLTFALLPFKNEGERPTLLKVNPFDEFCHQVQKAYPDIFKKKRNKKRKIEPTS